uniref:hypothetical protein n=1 Tax=Pedobacter sp. FW305-3-2-15-E-R2A2 TaxID=3140251 RepID=UPI00406C91DF
MNILLFKTFPVHYWYNSYGYNRVLKINNNGSYPVYVFYHDGMRNHVYTINPNDYPYAQNGYVNLGVNFYAIKP